MNNEFTGFIVDTMLGRLAKWLRVMGLDAHYQSTYKKKEFEYLLNKGRILVTRNRALKDKLNPSILILSDRIQNQLLEIKKNGVLPETNENWFKRCIRCNIPLKSVNIKDAQGRIPEYIISQNIEGIHHCTSCNRYFWPGSHRKRMLKQIMEWGLAERKNTDPPLKANGTDPPAAEKSPVTD